MDRKFFKVFALNSLGRRRKAEGIKKLIMNCDDVLKKLSPYLDNEVDENTMVKIQSHLKTCLQCRQEYEILAENTKFMLNLPEIEPSPYFVQQTLAKIRIAGKERKGFFVWVSVPAMTVLILILMSYFVLFEVKVAAIEPQVRKKIYAHCFESAVKGSHILTPISFKRFCKKCCDILCECKISLMHKEMGIKNGD